MCLAGRDLSGDCIPNCHPYLILYLSFCYIPNVFLLLVFDFLGMAYKDSDYIVTVAAVHWPSHKICSETHLSVELWPHLFPSKSRQTIDIIYAQTLLLKVRTWQDFPTGASVLMYQYIPCCTKQVHKLGQAAYMRGNYWEIWSINVQRTAVLSNTSGRTFSSTWPNHIFWVWNTIYVQIWLMRNKVWHLPMYCI